MNNISFGKKLQAMCNTLNSNKSPQKCFIYKLDAKDDKEYFQKLKNPQDWSGSDFLPFIDFEFRANTDEPNQSLYTLETKDGKCLAFMHTTKDKNSFNIDVLETAPACTTNGEKRLTKAKYVGESFLSFLVSLAKAQNVKYVALEAVDSAVDFYSDKCHFKQHPTDKSYFVMLDKQYNRLINQNKSHTISGVDILV